eukprot:scaffold77043_cov26-Prasinocladus_malaysianus.AAC.2
MDALKYTAILIIEKLAYPIQAVCLAQYNAMLCWVMQCWAVLRTPLQSYQYSIHLRFRFTQSRPKAEAYCCIRVHHETCIACIASAHCAEKIVSLKWSPARITLCGATLVDGYLEVQNCTCWKINISSSEAVQRCDLLPLLLLPAI